MTKRYRLVCVAPEVPDHGSYDDLDEAIVHSDAFWEVYDTETDTWPGPASKAEYDEAVERWRSKNGVA